MLIRVAETHEIMLQPELGTVLIAVTVEGAEKAAVSSSATTTLADLTVRVTELMLAGFVTSFDQGQLQNTAHRPWNQDGRQLPWVYRTTATLNAQFNDFRELFAFIEDVATVPGVEVRWVNWELTDATANSARTEAETEVVRRAIERAQRIANTVGAIKLTPQLFADPGFTVGNPVYPVPMPRMAMAEARATAGGSGLEFRPEEIVVSAKIEAEFTAELPGAPYDLKP